jgi:hypothetical protein
LKRTVIDVLRRGFENALANWPLILIRIAEGVVLVVIVIGSVIAAIIPIIVAAGMNKFDFGNPDNAAQLLATQFIEHWVLVLYLLGLATLIFGVLIAVHSFVEAGAARVYIDGEHVAGFRAFAIDRWWEGGRRGWWAVFWIYNLAWSLGALILLIPLVFTIIFMLMVSGAGVRVALGCAGLALTVLLLIPIGIIVGIWTQKAIAICVARALGAVEALGAARREIKLDFGRHLAVALVLMAIGFAVAMVVSGANIPFSFGDNRHLNLLPLLLAPMQIMLSILQTAISAAIGAWTLSSFVALTEE